MSSLWLVFGGMVVGNFCMFLLGFIPKEMLVGSIIYPLTLAIVVTILDKIS